MKYSSIALLTLAGSAFANPTVQDDAPTFAEGPVTVTVTCPGTKLIWSKLSLLELTTAGKALTESYNAIHAMENADDSTLSDLVFGGGKKRNMLQVEEESNLDSWFKPRPSKGVWSGTWGCTECPDDDTPDVSGPVLMAWQSKFVANLLESKVLAFQSIRKCNIDLEPAEDTLSGIPNADIVVDCGKNFDLSVLSVSMGAYLSHAVQTSYNKVHADNANDDSELTNVYYYKKGSKSLSSEGVVDDEESLGGRFNFGPHNPYKPYHSKGVAAPGLSGWWGCRLCPSDDDVMLSSGSNSTKAMERHGNKLFTASSGPLLQAWEAELNVALQRAPFPPFKKIEWCDIKLVPYTKFFLEDSEEENEDRGCGIRGGCKDSDVSME